MILTPKTKISRILSEYPFIKDFLMKKNKHFKALDNPVMMKTIGKMATLSRAAMMGGIDTGELMKEISAEIKGKTGDDVPVEAGTALKREEKIEAMKEIIRKLHDGGEVSSLKDEFNRLIQDAGPSEVAQMEQSLINEGMPEDEVKRLCDVHVEVFRDSLDRKTVPGLPAGHPVHTYMKENREAEYIINEISHMGDTGADHVKFSGLMKSLADINIHYVRKENQLFPLLEERGITGPSKVMWAKHDDVREAMKLVRASMGSGSVSRDTVNELVKMVNDMIYKEENILFPMALDTLSSEDWVRVRNGEDEIGYAWIEKPESPEEETVSHAEVRAADTVGSLNLDTGNLTSEQINLILTHLPVDISFVNEDDEVVYYSNTEERIFPRSPAVIGRAVQNCHPPKSVDTVEKILEEFKKGSRNSAEFWIQLGGKFVHIRYFAVRDGRGAYRGTLEVSQDLTRIRELQGEKRLLDRA